MQGHGQRTPTMQGGHPAEVTYLQTCDAHAKAAGALCRDDGNGICKDCHVGMDECFACTGIGYHRAGCPESEPEGELSDFLAFDADESGDPIPDDCPDCDGPHGFCRCGFLDHDREGRAAIAAATGAQS